jgi:ubiquinone/menaquinone biosynthesis C-methylase UbiE
MLKERIPETNEGIQNTFDVLDYDEMQKKFSKKKWFATDSIIKSGVNRGNCLEVGPGPGYLGIDWLKKTSGTILTALEISKTMIEVAEKNCKDAGISERAEYISGNASKMPFEDDRFDGIFTNGSLHEWEEPEKVISEIYRVLKPGAKIFIGDLKRNINPALIKMMKMGVKSKSMKRGLETSVSAAYIKPELEEIMHKSPFQKFHVNEDAFGIEIVGEK